MRKSCQILCWIIYNRYVLARRDNSFKHNNEIIQPCIHVNCAPPSGTWAQKERPIVRVFLRLFHKLEKTLYNYKMQPLRWLKLQSILKIIAGGPTVIARYILIKIQFLSEKNKVASELCDSRGLVLNVFLSNCKTSMIMSR